jgi:hypothetical protein
MEAMPENVKKNPLMRKLWNLPRTEDMNVVGLFLGSPGKGKSTAAIKFAEILDSSFNVERIVFDIHAFLKLVDEGDSFGKLKAGSVIVFDESAGSSEAADSRNSLTQANKTLSYFATISRAKNLTVFYVLPLLSQLDKRLRLIGTTFVLVLKGINKIEMKSKAVFYWAYSNPLSSKILMPHPRLKDSKTGEVLAINSVWITLPESKELLKAYKVKKMAFIDAQIKQWRGELSEKKHGRMKKINLNSYFEKARACLWDLKDGKGNYSVAMIRGKFNLSENTAKALKAMLNNVKSAD